MSLKNAIGGVALIAGTAIGAAVLALPVATAHLGYISTISIYGICWFFMTLGALYLLEANLFIGFGTNLVSMAEKTLGKGGKYLTWVVYLILLYALTSAYLTGAGAWLEQLLTQLGLGVGPIVSAVLATLLTMTIIVLGTCVTDWVNRLLMIGLIGSFATLLFVVSDHIGLDLLNQHQNIFDITPIPLIITAFGSAIVIPTLTEYLHGKPKQLLHVVLIGCAIPLLIYIIWETAILGTIPSTGKLGLLDIQENGNPAIDITLALKQILNIPWITKASSYFSIFALSTSLLGVSLSLFDFLNDGLHLHKRFREKILLASITFLPPLVFIIYFPFGFILALSFAGAFVAILLGILPALMVWQGRYRLQLSRPLEIVGGKPLLILTMAFFVIVAIIEIVIRCGVLG